MNKSAAEEIHAFLVEQAKGFQRTLQIVKSNSSPDEFELYTVKVTQIIALMFDYMDFLYNEYPDLKPPSFDD